MNNIKSIPVKTWYLEMRDPPQTPLPTFSFDVNIVRAYKPTTSFYQYLYTQVGKGYSWYNRLIMFETELQSIIHDDRTVIYVLWVGGVPAGFCELDLRNPKETEIVYFGLLSEFRGRGLGKKFLDWTVHQAWMGNPERIWLHTCELDDKAALPIYLKAGFLQYDERLETQKLINPLPESDKFF